MRQGGILSPYLFAVFMDELSCILNESIYGCKLGIKINHLFYADDLCLLASSVFALQKLLDICNEFAMSNSIVFNERNLSVCTL